MRPVSDYENWIETVRDLETIRGYYWQKRRVNRGLWLDSIHMRIDCKYYVWII